MSVCYERVDLINAARAPTSGSPRYLSVMQWMRPWGKAEYGLCEIWRVGVPALHLTLCCSDNRYLRNFDLDEKRWNADRSNGCVRTLYGLRYTFTRLFTLHLRSLVLYPLLISAFLDDCFHGNRGRWRPLDIISILLARVTIWLIWKCI